MPTPIRWHVPIDPSSEARVAAKLRGIGTFYGFLREIRADGFDDAFPSELTTAYRPSGVAPTSLPP
jgi:hypothetical protein